jgi:hypothetical protein
VESRKEEEENLRVAAEEEGVIVYPDEEDSWWIQMKRIHSVYSVYSGEKALSPVRHVRG